MACFVCNSHGHWARNCPLKINNNKCFACNQPGHWAENCPNVAKTCQFCGQDGHDVSECAMKEKRMVYDDNLSIQDIMYNCALACDPAIFDNLTKQVDKLVMRFCSNKGYVDEYKLAQLVFVTFDYTYNIFDEGHLKMLGYIIKKYISADNSFLKDFLYQMRVDYKGACMSFDEVVKDTFNLVIVNQRNGNISFRKRIGALI